jgi:hypothetical protein
MEPDGVAVGEITLALDLGSRDRPTTGDAGVAPSISPPRGLAAIASQDPGRESLDDGAEEELFL